MGTTRPSLSDDGSRLAFQSDIDPQDGLFQENQQVYVWETAGDEITLVSDRAGVAADADVFDPHLSGNGAVVAYASAATNLVDLPPGACTAAAGCPCRVYVHDLAASGPELVARTQAGQLGRGVSEAPAVSQDGRQVVFADRGGDLVSPVVPPSQLGDIVQVDRDSGRRTRISVTPAGAPTPLLHSRPAISSSGRSVAFLSDAPNALLDRSDLQGSTSWCGTARVSSSPPPPPSAPCSSARRRSWHPSWCRTPAAARTCSGPSG